MSLSTATLGRLRARANRFAAMVRKPVTASTAQRGMTLLEIMIVIAILGLIASVVVVAVMNNLERAKVNTCRLKINEVRKALDLYRVDNDDYPSQSEGLRALISPPHGGPPYLKDKETPRDSWGQELMYYNPARGGGGSVEVMSKGPDRQEGTQDDVKAK